MFPKNWKDFRFEVFEDIASEMDGGEFKEVVCVVGWEIMDVVRCPE